MSASMEVAAEVEINDMLGASWDEALILEVSKHPNLYDPNCPDKDNKTSRINSWTEIGSKLDVSVPICKSRWRNIRTQYVKIKKRTETGLNTSKRQWHLYNMLTFLDDKDFKPSITTLIQQRRNRKLLPRPRVLAPAPPMRFTDTSIMSHLEVHSAPEAERTVDADEHYLLSLAPAFRRLTERAKAEARINIETVLYNAEFGAD